MIQDVKKTTSKNYQCNYDQDKLFHALELLCIASQLHVDILLVF